MVRELYDKIKNQEEVRENLIQLKAVLKEEKNRYALLYYIGVDYSVFYELLLDLDAKVRKNVAIVMGQLGVPEFVEKLHEAYKREETLFVRSAYLMALREYDYRRLLPDLKERVEKIRKIKPQESEKKHLAQELKVLTDMILGMEGVKKHKFTGYQVSEKIVLLTNRDHKAVTLGQLKGMKVKEFNAGVMVQSEDLRKILPIRTYQELLFVPQKNGTCSPNYKEAGEKLADTLKEFMEVHHNGQKPYYFRLECKLKMDLEQKSSFAKKLAAQIEEASHGALINSTSHYEVELRLIERKEGDLNVLIKLYTMEDIRFSYRKHALAASIQPVNAALIVALAKEYLGENAQVLDPFCGVGTMLIERDKLVKTRNMYGVDIYGKAIELARENTEAAGVLVNYINRDFADFRHEYLFDEVITNMPRVQGHKGEEDIRKIYQLFFEKIRVHLKPDGIFILYSHNRELVLKFMNPKEYRLEKEYMISKKEGVYLFIGKRIGQ